MKFSNIIICMLFLMYVMASCRPKKVEGYLYHIPQARMMSLMIDIKIIEGAVATFAEKDRDSVRSVYMTQFYKIHKMSKPGLDSIFEDLRHNTELYYLINKDVADTIRKMETSYNQKD